MCHVACSGPLPRATNATAPFFNDLIYFNASSNNLTGPIPEDFGHTELFNTSSVYYQIGAAAFTRSAAFDVSNNQLSGDLPTFLTPSRVPRPLLKTSGVTLLVSTPCRLYESTIQSRYICGLGCSFLHFVSRKCQDTSFVCVCICM